LRNTDGKGISGGTTGSTSVDELLRQPAGTTGTAIVSGIPPGTGRMIEPGVAERFSGNPTGAEPIVGSGITVSWFG
jgi:hypothetical protein